MNEKTIYIFCDGGCKVHSSKIGGYGIVLLYDKYKKSIYGFREDATNNQMEILAATIALQKLTIHNIPVVVTSDSEYVVKGVNEWSKKWVRQNWKGAGKKAIKNIDQWKVLLAEISKFSMISFIHCYGHSDNEYNNEADRLATYAIAHKECKEILTWR